MSHGFTNIDTDDSTLVKHTTDNNCETHRDAVHRFYKGFLDSLNLMVFHSTGRHVILYTPKGSRAFLVQIFKIPINPQQHTLQIPRADFQSNQTINVEIEARTEIRSCHWTRYAVHSADLQTHNRVTKFISSFLSSHFLHKPPPPPPPLYATQLRVVCTAGTPLCLQQCATILLSSHLRHSTFWSLIEILLILLCVTKALCVHVVCLIYINCIGFSSFVTSNFTGQLAAWSCNNALFTSHSYETNQQWNIPSCWTNCQRYIAGNGILN